MIPNELSGIRNAGSASYVSRGRVPRWLPHGQGLPEHVWRTRHISILILLWAHVVAIVVYALLRGFTTGHALLEASVVAGPAALAMSPRLSRRARTVAASLGVLFSSAVLIHLSGGLIEMHFHFFVMVAVVALYQDWVPFLLAIAYVLVHHGVMGALDPRSVYNHPAAIASPWKWAAVHAFFISGISAVCLVTWKLNETLLLSRTRAEQEKASLYEAERRARREAEHARERLEILAEVGRRMTSTLDPDAALQGIAQVLVPALGDVCFIDVVDEDGSIRRVISLVAPSTSELADSLVLVPPEADDVGHPIVETLAGAGAVLLDGASAHLTVQRPSKEPLQETLPVSSAVVAPLTGRHEVLGTLTLVATRHSQQDFDADDLALAEQIGRRAGTALENARLYEQQRDVAKGLQKSLLPRELPDVPGLRTVATYLPGGPSIDVGGDWYDVFVLPGGDIAFVIGDVMGRGVHAAALMGQLRTALRVFALEGLRPAEVMNKLHRLVESDDSEYLATGIYGVLSLDRPSICFSNAAHPPPLIANNEGFVRLVEGGISPPLGAMPHARYAETTVDLGEAETLFLYTDGLVEDRETSLEDGIIRLTAALQTAPNALQSLPDHVLSSVMIGRSADDDVAFLAIKTIPIVATLELRVPSDPRLLAPLRAVLRRWLEKVGVPHDKSFEVLVACGEACANAIEHASDDGSGHFLFTATAGPDILISVRDRGQFKSSTHPDRGRGIPVMKAMSDTLHIEKTSEGTDVRLRFLNDPRDVPA